MRLVLVGPPGAGKGTQARSSPSGSASRTSPPATCSAPTCSSETALGLEAKRYMDAGDLVPDEVTVAWCATGSPTTTPPRASSSTASRATCSQADVARASCSPSAARTLDAVVELQVPEDELVERLLGRGRADDTEDVIRRRQQVYRDETAPLLAYYRDRLGQRRRRRHGRGDHRPGDRRARARGGRRRDGRPASAAMLARWRGRDIELKTPASWTRCAPRARWWPARSPRSPRRRRPGVSTGELDALAEQTIRDGGAVPSFLGYHGFPASASARR